MKRTPLRRTGRVRPKRAPRRREAPQEDATWWHEANILLQVRSKMRCEKCGNQLLGGVERHHRSRRRDGGDRLSNLLLLHSQCHRWVTEHPAEARESGWIVSSWDDPAETVVVHPLHGVVFLRDDGTYQAAA